jgi:hypothetical protein
MDPMEQIAAEQAALSDTTKPDAPERQDRRRFRPGGGIPGLRTPDLAMHALQSIFPGLDELFESIREKGRQAKATPTDLPALPTSMYGIPGMIADLSDQKYGFHLPGEEAGNKFSEWVFDLSNRLHQVGDPDNPASLFARIAPTALVPLGGGPIGAFLQGAPKAAKFAGNVLDVLALPGVFGKYTPLKAAANVGLPYGAASAITEHVEGYTGEEHETIFDVIGLGDILGDPSGGDPGEQDPMEIIAKQQQAQQDQGPLDPFGGVAQIMDDEQLAEVVDALDTQDLNLDDQERGTTIGEQAILGSLLIAGAIGARRGLPRGLRLPTSPGKPRSDFLGTPVDRTSETTAATALEAAAINRFSPLEAALKKLSPNEVGDTVAAAIDTTANNTAMASRVGDSLTTGVLPNSTLRMPSLVVHWKALARITDDQRKLYDDATLAGTYLDEFNMAVRKNPKEGLTPAHGFSVKQLRSMDNAVNADPVARGLVADAREIMRVMRLYMRERGVITADQSNFWRDNAPNYMPTALAFKTRTMADDFIKKMNPEPTGADFSLPEFEHLMPRVGGGNIGRGRGISPAELLDSYIMSVIRKTEINSLRVRFLDAIDADSGKASWAKRIEKGSSAKNQITVLRDGKAVQYSILDPSIYTALKFSPQQAMGLLNWMRRWKQELTTGLLRPDFVPISLAYEVQSAAVMRPTGRGLGIGDEIVKMVWGKRGIPILDPTVIISPFTGSARGIYSDFARAMSIQGQVYLKTHHPGVASMLGEHAVRKLAETAAAAYERSSKRLFQQYGGGNAAFIENALRDDAVSMVPRLAPEFFVKTRQQNKRLTAGQAEVRGRSLWNSYSSLMENLHNSVRLQAAAANIRVKGGGIITDVDELTRVMRDIRRLTGDVAAGGQGGPNLLGVGIFTWLRGSVPYANHAAQVMAQHVRMVKQHPTRYWGVLGGMMLSGTWLLTNQFIDDPISEHHYWNILTPDDRARKVHIYGAPGVVEHTIPITPEFRPLWSPYIETFGALYGFKNADMWDEGLHNIRRALGENFGTVFDERAVAEIRRGFRVGWGDVLGDPTPPLVGAGLAAVGQTTRLGTRGTLLPVRDSRIDPMSTSRVSDAGLPAVVDEMMQALLGATARIVSDGIVAWDQSSKAGAGTARKVARTFDHAMDSVRNRQPFFRSTVIGTTERVKTSNIDQRLLSGKRAGLDQLMELMGRNISPTGTRTGFRASEPLPGGIPPIIRGTELEFVGEHMYKVSSFLAKVWTSRISDKYRQMESLEADRSMGRHEKTVAKNRIAHEIRILNREALQFLTEQEDSLSQRLGRPFRLDNFDLDELRSAKSPVSNNGP